MASTVHVTPLARLHLQLSQWTLASQWRQDRDPINRHVKFQTSERNRQFPDSAGNNQGKVAQNQRNRSRSRSVSKSPPHYSLTQDRRARSRSPPRHSKQYNSSVDRREKTRPKSPSPEKDGYRRQHASGYTRKLSLEELEHKRQEMMQDAKWREKDRINNIRKYKQEEDKERDLEKRNSKKRKFIHDMKLDSAASSSLEDRVKRNIHSIQRTSSALEKSFIQR
uniref:Pre-mRNA-splicing factor CWC25 homolog n=1 Tax=Geotrypetes seraphini TaxID=260995 RepID=A0A6P8NXE1_GEOSA|nr:pre-mRNA-splicing factor CWC25 homolog [Geotrypetes seraphini]